VAVIARTQTQRRSSVALWSPDLVDPGAPAASARWAPLTASASSSRGYPSVGDPRSLGDGSSDFAFLLLCGRLAWTVHCDHFDRIVGGWAVVMRGYGRHTHGLRIQLLRGVPQRVFGFRRTARGSSGGGMSGTSIAAAQPWGVTRPGVARRGDRYGALLEDGAAAGQPIKRGRDAITGFEAGTNQKESRDLDAFVVHQLVQRSRRAEPTR
jgi:hypothetical protein